MNTPILFLIFNRPDTTIRVFSKIKETRPAKLYIAADGPRPGKAGEIEACNKTREIAQLIDWPCEVKTLFRENNLGCKMAVSSAIDWFFEQEEEGIILEDDCMPGASFFSFCEKLLEKYRHDERIMHISGDNFQFGEKRGHASYYFSRFNHVWGWASWRRAWQHYHVHLNNFEAFRDERIMDKVFDEPTNREFWIKTFLKVKNNQVDTWDYQWTYAMWTQNGLSILPNVNLISNIGFGSGTHTQQKKSMFADIPTVELNQLIHPLFLYPDKEADKFTMKKMYLSSFSKIISYKFSKWFNR